MGYKVRVKSVIQLETIPDGASMTANLPPTGQGEVGRELDSTGSLGWLRM